MAGNHEILEAINKLNADMQTSIEQLRSDFRQANINNEEKFIKQEARLNTHERRLAEQEREHRQNNVIIFGIPETEENRKKLENIVMDLFNNTLEVPTNLTEINYIRRLGTKKENNNRPVLVRFLAYRKTVDIFSNRSKLGGTNLQLWEDLPKEVIEERKKLIPIMKQQREKGHFAILKYDKLYVNGKVFKNNHPETQILENKKRPPPGEIQENTPTRRNSKERKTTTIRRNSLTNSVRPGGSGESILQYLQKEKLTLSKQSPGIMDKLDDAKTNSSADNKE